MKKLLVVLAAASFVACSGGTTTETTVDSAADAKKDMIDSSAAAKKDMIDSSADAKKAMVDSAAKMADTTKGKKQFGISGSYNYKRLYARLVYSSLEKANPAFKSIFFKNFFDEAGYFSIL